MSEPFDFELTPGEKPVIPPPPRTDASAAPRVPVASEPNTAVDLDNLGRTRRPIPVIPMRPRVPTLVFHGSPPIQSTMRPPPPRPSLASDSAITPRFLLHDLSSDDLVDDEVNTRTPKPPPLPTRTTEGAGRADDRETSPARTDRPPPPGASRSWRLVAAFGCAVAAALGVGSSVLTALSSPTLAIPVVIPAARPEAKATATPAAAASASRVGCFAQGEPRVVARHAVVAGGLETYAFGTHLLVGFATGPREGRAMELDRETLAVVSSARIVAGQLVRRVVPVPVPDEGIDAFADTDDKRDALVQTRTSLDAELAPFVIGTAGGKLAWRDPKRDRTDVLATLAGGAPVEALRAVAWARAQSGFAVAYRRGGAIWVGEHAADATNEPRRISDAGRYVGAPQLALIDREVLVAWAERQGTKAPWGIKWLRWTPGAIAGAPRSFLLPAGGLGEHAMSPTVAGAGGGAAFVAWTEGPVSAHQVRGQMIDRDGAPIGAAITLSPQGANAGQAQVVLDETGRGAVTFLAAGARGFDVVVAKISCES